MRLEIKIDVNGKAQKIDTGGKKIRGRVLETLGNMRRDQHP